MGRGKKGNLYQLIPLSEKIQNITRANQAGQVITEQGIVNLLGDWWDGFWRDMSRVDKEGGVLMKESKKPERLILWILSLLTKPGDLVLDAYLGSGTTAAVSHKMKRRWIGIEMGEHCDTLALKRLRRVVDGSDKTGVTRSVGWSGGGGFRYYEVRKND